MADKSEPASGDADGDADKKICENVKCSDGDKGAVSKRPPLSRRAGNSSLQLNRAGSKSNASGASASTSKQFKKCMSATFQIDGQYYTIGRLI